MHFPVYLHWDSARVHPHVFFETLSYLTAGAAYFCLRMRFKDRLDIPLRWAVVACAIVGAAFGARILYWFEDPQLTLDNLNNLAYLLGGKTIVGALIGGLVAVEGAKRYIGIQQSTGDLFAIPLAIGIAVGRIGCFLTGLSDNTYGLPTSLPWGIDFGDGIKRHPTQLYECIFLFGLVPVLYRVLGQIDCRRPDKRFRSGDGFRIFMIAYLGFRLICDSIKPYIHVAFGLCSIQLACLLMLAYYSKDVLRWFSLIHIRVSSPSEDGNGTMGL